MILLTYSDALKAFGSPFPTMLDGIRLYAESYQSIVSDAIILHEADYGDRQISEFLTGDLYGVLIHGEHGVWMHNGKMIDAVVLYQDKHKADSEFNALIAHYDAHARMDKSGLFNGE